MGGCASTETREMKIATTEKLIQKYNVNICLFMELNFNWSKVGSSADLASWFQCKERETQCVTAHNIQENDIVFVKHQPGGTGMLCRHKIPTVRKEHFDRPTRVRQMVLLALLLQSLTHYTDPSRIPAVHSEGKRSENSLPAIHVLHSDTRP
jgi:hypothetical protein